MTTFGKTAIVATILLLAIPVTASAGGRNEGPNWGTVVGAGVLGGVIGGALAPAPQIIVVAPPSQPIYAVPQQPTSVSPPPTERTWWCPSSHRWYPEVFACAVPWSH